MEKKKFQQSVIEKRCRQLRNRASMSESEHKKKKKTNSISAVRQSLIHVFVNYLCNHFFLPIKKKFVYLQHLQIRK